MDDYPHSDCDIQMPSSVDSRDRQPFKSDLVESQGHSRPSSSKVEESQHHDEEKGVEPTGFPEKAFDTRSTKTTESVIPPPPDGGLHAWLKVFGGFMIYARSQLALPVCIC